MKNKKSIIVVVGVVLFIALICFCVFTKQDKNTSFTLLEKQWLDSNKSKIVDIAILKDVPIVSYNGTGILFDFLESFEEVTELDFNPIAYQSGEEIKSDYSFQVVTQKDDSDILIYSDNYVLLTNSSVKYNKLSEIDNITIGVLESDLGKVQNIMDNMNIDLKQYGSIDELVTAVKQKTNENGEIVKGDVDAIVLPRISNLNLIVSNKLNISYNINEIKQDYVIKLGSDEKLNDVLTKYYKKWSDSNYSESFNKNFSNSYFSFSGIDDKEKAEFKSKKYVYGYLDNKPYDVTIDNNLYGINKAFLDDFSKASGVDVEYRNYSDIESLTNDFNINNVDILFDDTVNEFSNGINLVSNYDEQGVVLALPSNKVSVSSVKSLIGYDVSVISNSKLSEFLKSSGVSVKEYSDLSLLIDKAKDDTVIVLDSEQYNFYGLKSLSKYKSIYTFDILDDYQFKVYNSDANKIFINFFNFYLSFVSSQQISNLGYSELVSLTSTKGYISLIIVFISVLLVGLIGLLIYQSIKSKKNGDNNKVVVVKDNKIKYIDVLTSLKNRNYLNDNIDSWDESLVYPQGIVIVDLNNIAYINDNYGHSEGDKVIKEAANILIKNQISNTEIIRTNGNEFLIYMVGYDEKQIVSYIRKLSKEFKDLSHDFGAAIGYSIITDEIKTVDDAINEATMDMKNNKQESH